MTTLSAEERMGVAYLAGRAARKKGENVESCPYAPGTTTFTAWENGWREKNVTAAADEDAPVRPMRPENLGPVDRSSAGLRAAMFDELDALRSGKTDAKRAGAVAKMASSIIETVRLELDVAKWSGQKNVARSGNSVALAEISFKPSEQKSDK